MRRRREGTGDRTENELLELGRRIPAPSEEDLRSMARQAATRSRLAPGPARLRRRSRRLTLTWTVAPVALALLVGSGLGFGVGSTVTPSGSASPSVGTGFLPARGWTVFQSGSLGSTGTARAVASNVPLAPGATLGRSRVEIAAALPRRGILIDAVFSSRGDPLEDFKFAPAALPLGIASASRIEHDGAPGSPENARYRLRVGISGTNVDAWILFGSAEPSARQLAAAQRQLSRLVVAAERVTLVARPLVVAGLQPAIVFGTVSSGREDETVTIQARDCGQRSYTNVAAVLTHAGGTYTLEYNRGITSTVRATWKGVASPPATIRQQARVEFVRLPSRRFSVAVVGRASLWRRQIQIQRRQGGSWKTVRTVVLSDQGAAPGSAFIWNRAEFALKVPRGSLLRAVMSAAQARPCFLAGVSRTVRT